MVKKKKNPGLGDILSCLLFSWGGGRRRREGAACTISTMEGREGLWGGRQAHHHPTLPMPCANYPLTAFSLSFPSLPHPLSIYNLAYIYYALTLTTYLLYFFYPSHICIPCLYTTYLPLGNPTLYIHVYTNTSLPCPLALPHTHGMHACTHGTCMLMQCSCHVAVVEWVGQA